MAEETPLNIPEEFAMRSPGLDISMALVEALAKRFGDEFVIEVRANIIRRAEALSASEVPKERAMGANAHETAASDWWDAIISEHGDSSD